MEQKIILEGILEGISEVGSLKHKSWKRGEPPAEVKVVGLYSALVIKTEEGLKNQRYDGIILPDSIGHKIEVYEYNSGITDEDKEIIVLDTELDRWYR